MNYESMTIEEVATFELKEPMVPVRQVKAMLDVVGMAYKVEIAQEKDDQRTGWYIAEMKLAIGAPLSSWYQTQHDKRDCKNHKND